MWAESGRDYDWLTLPTVPAHWSISPRTVAAVLPNKQHKSNMEDSAERFYAARNGVRFQKQPSHRSALYLFNFLHSFSLTVMYKTVQSRNQKLSALLKSHSRRPISAFRKPKCHCIHILHG
jgi:hypothetical protein